VGQKTALWNQVDFLSRRFFHFFVRGNLSSGPDRARTVPLLLLCGLTFFALPAADSCTTSFLVRLAAQVPRVTAVPCRDEESKVGTVWSEGGGKKALKRFEDGRRGRAEDAVYHLVPRARQNQPLFATARAN
jgi:hypothetical protein